MFIATATATTDPTLLIVISGIALFMTVIALALALYIYFSVMRDKKRLQLEEDKLKVERHAQAVHQKLNAKDQRTVAPPAPAFTFGGGEDDENTIR